MRDKIIKCSKTLAKNLAIAGGVTFAMLAVSAFIALATLLGRSLFGDVGLVVGFSVGVAVLLAIGTTAVSCWKE